MVVDDALSARAAAAPVERPVLVDAGAVESIHEIDDGLRGRRLTLDLLQREQIDGLRHAIEVLTADALEDRVESRGRSRHRARDVVLGDAEVAARRDDSAIERHQPQMNERRHFSDCPETDRIHVNSLV